MTLAVEHSLRDRRQRPVGDGAVKLLVALVREGLDERAHRAAAALAMELDLQAGRRKEKPDAR